MAANKTSLSAGAIIRALLADDPDVTAITDKIYPVVTDEAKLPYIVYARTGLVSDPHKSGGPGADEVNISVLCMAARYHESVDLAEAVRGALDNCTAVHDGLRMRVCQLSNASEDWANDAFIQRLDFRIKI